MLNKLSETMQEQGLEGLEQQDPIEEERQKRLKMLSRITGKMNNILTSISNVSNYDQGPKRRKRVFEESLAHGPLDHSIKVRKGLILSSNN